MDFADSGRPQGKIGRKGKNDKYLDLARELKKTVDLERDAQNTEKSPGYL